MAQKFPRGVILILSSLSWLIRRPLAYAAFGCCCFLGNRAAAQIFVDYGPGIATFSACGVPINTNFITGLNGPQGIAISGTNLFVANNFSGTIGEYSITGQTINTHFAIGAGEVEGLAISGTNLFATDFGELRIYNTNSTFEGYFLSGSGSDGIAIDGTNILIAVFSQNVIAEYSPSGRILNADLISVPSVSGVATDGTNIYTAALPRIGKYAMNGTPVNTNLISVYGYANNVVVNGNFLYVIGTYGMVGLYKTDGTVINTNLFTIPFFTNNYYYPLGLAIVPPASPIPNPPLSITVSNQSTILSWSTNFFSFMPSATTDLSSNQWNFLTNTPSVLNTNYSVTLPATNSALFFRLQNVF